MRSVDIGSLAGALSNADPVTDLLLGIADDPPFYRSWIELKADPAGVSSGVVATPSDVGQETAAIHSLNPERLLAAQIASEPKAASLFGGILHKHLVGENRTVLVPSANGDWDS
jgi:hypothetical protein